MHKSDFFELESLNRKLTSRNLHIRWVQYTPEEQINSTTKYKKFEATEYLIWKSLYASSSHYYSLTILEHRLNEDVKSIIAK